MILSLLSIGSEGAGVKAQKNPALTLSQLIEMAVEKGGIHEAAPTQLSRDLGDEPGTKLKFLDKEESDAEDALERSFYVALSSSGQPQRLSLLRKKREKEGSRSFWASLDLKGQVQAAFFLEGKYDAEGKPVPGSRKKTDIEPADAKKLVKQELDFWLKGIGQKKTAGSGETSVKN